MGMQTIFLYPHEYNLRTLQHNMNCVFEKPSLMHIGLSQHIIHFHLTLLPFPKDSSIQAGKYNCTDVTYIIHNLLRCTLSFINWNTLLCQAPGKWEDVRIIVERPGPVDRNGPCANSLPQDDIKHGLLPAG